MRMTCCFDVWRSPARILVFVTAVWCVLVPEMALDEAWTSLRARARDLALLRASRPDEDGLAPVSAAPGRGLSRPRATRVER